MNDRRIQFHDRFRKSLMKLSPEIILATQESLRKYKSREAGNGLKPEPKNGSPEFWAIRVTQNYRAFFVKMKDDMGRYDLFFHVGPHDDYRSVSRFVPK